MAQHSQDIGMEAANQTGFDMRSQYLDDIFGKATISVRIRALANESMADIISNQTGRPRQDARHAWFEDIVEV